MKHAFAFLTLTAALAGCVHTQPPAAASLEGKPRIPVNQHPAPVAPESPSSTPHLSGA